jgi:hypothetical protein
VNWVLARHLGYRMRGISATGALNQVIVFKLIFSKNRALKSF